MLPFKHDTKRVCWLLDMNVYLLVSKLIAVTDLDIQRDISPERRITLAVELIFSSLTRLIK